MNFTVSTDLFSLVCIGASSSHKTNWMEDLMTNKWLLTGLQRCVGTMSECWFSTLGGQIKL